MRQWVWGGYCNPPAEVPKKWPAFGPITPNVSTVTRTKKWLESRWEYFPLFLHSISTATAQLLLLQVLNRRGPGWQNMWHPRPTLQGMMDAPSGHLPSDLQMYMSSKRDGSFDASNDLLTTSFTAPWRGWCPLLQRQLRPWVPRSSISASQWMHWWGRQRGKPRDRPTAILTTLLSPVWPPVAGPERQLIEHWAKPLTPWWPLPADRLVY